MRCSIEGCHDETWGGLPFCFGHSLEHVESALRSANQETMRDAVGKLLSTLTYREREVLKLRYGIGDNYTYTQAEVARIFKFSQSTAARVEYRAIGKLMHPVRLNMLQRMLGWVSLEPPSRPVIEAVRLCSEEVIAYLAKHPDRLRQMSSRDFERIVAEIFDGYGFQVELTQRTRDGGRDIVALTRDGLGLSTKYIVECKRYAEHVPVRVELVRSLYGVKQAERADHAILATTSYFTRDAEKFCRAPEVWNLHLRDFDAITEWLRNYERPISSKGAPLVLKQANPPPF